MPASFGVTGTGDSVNLKSPVPSLNWFDLTLSVATTGFSVA